MGYTLRRPPRSKIWHCYFIDRDGKRFRRTTKQSDKRRADFVASDWFRRFADPTYQAAHETTLEDAGRRMKEALVQKGRSPETVKFYGVKLSHVGRVMGADTPLARVTATRVDEYIAERKNEGAKPYTISKELTALRMLLRHARRRGEFDRELSQVMPIGFSTHYEPRQRRLTIDEAWALVRELPPNVGRYAAFVCATTARDAAVHRARGRDLAGDGIRIHDRKTKGATRTVPLNVVTEPFARFAFDGVSRDAMVAPGVGSVRHAFARACRRLSLARVSPNDLRRSVGHWLLARGVPRDLVAAFFGHVDTKMLDAVYGKLDAGELGTALRAALGSSLDGSGKSEPDPVDGADGVDPKTHGKQCPGTESNRRHGDFQSPSGPGKDGKKPGDPPAHVDDSWIGRRISDLRREAANDVDVAECFRRGVRKALARDEAGTLGEMREIARRTGGAS